MRNNKVLLSLTLITSLLLATLGLTLWSWNSKLLTDSELSALSSKRDQGRVDKTSGEVSPESSEDQLRSSQSSLNQVKLPASEDIRNELREDSHHTPESLNSFAEDMAPHMEKALDSEESAAMTFNFLEQCVSNTPVAHTVKMMCMINAQRIARAFPARFQKRNDDLLKSLPEDAQKLVQDYFSESGKNRR